MGQHKRNPTAILAKTGKLLPKPNNPSNAQLAKDFETLIRGQLSDQFPILKIVKGLYQ